MKKISVLMLCSLFISSCSSDLDFAQANVFEINPTIVANFVTFDINASQFVENFSENAVLTDLTKFKIFNDSHYNENIDKIEIKFEIENSISRGYDIVLHFLDINEVAVLKIPFAIVPMHSNNAQKTTSTYIFAKDEMDILQKTKKLAYEVKMHPGPSLVNHAIGDLKFRSISNLYFKSK